jgi:N-acetylmuramoyl-L-alanine amidase
MNYLKALLKKDEQKKIDELKNIIILGEQLNKNVTPDKKKLEILIERRNKNIVSTKKTDSTTQRESISSSSNNKDLFYSIKSVYTSNNNIIIDFNTDINQDDIKFFELNQNPLYKDVFDISGYFKDAIPTKLDINGIEKITIGQFKPDVLRIVLSDKKNLNTSYTVNKKQIIISLTESSTKKEESQSVVKNSINKNSIENNIDLKNSINSIKTQDNKIIVKFNKNYYKKDVQFVRYKNSSNFENVFNITGKYKYIEPLQLSIDGVDKIISTQNSSNSIKIRIINNDDQKVNYTLNNRELVITIYQKNKTSTPIVQQRLINKTIVIDAGHGGDDVGAVGHNKRYEKVINLNVSKYLYSLLKQRGYKVYLTRNNDTFIKVMNRTVLANDKNADIFISIHTNSVPKEKAHEVAGIETFFLSPARNERAKRVAALENKSDIREMSNSSKDVFLESLNRPRITASHKLAIDVQAGLLQSSRSKYNDINDSGVREGPFWVLVGAQMPSILVELGYVSHPIESKRLYHKEYQQLLANGIANGVDSYFSKNP